MSGLDLRPSWSVMEAAFGLPITLTRPAPDNAPIRTTGIWVPLPLDEQQPVGHDLNRIDPRRLMAIGRAVASTMPRGTTVLAAEALGSVTKTWRVDGINRVDAEHWRVILIEVSAL